MDGGLLHIIFQMGVFVTDGIVWWLGVKLFLTGFFGYSLKKSKYRTAVAVGVVALNAALATICLIISTHGVEPLSWGNGFLSFFLFLYYGFYVKETGKVKRFFIAFFSEELFSCMYALIAGFFNLISSDFAVGRFWSLAGVFLQPLLTLLIAWILSEVSSRRRREPMAFSLVLITFIFSVLLDTMVAFFSAENYGQVHPIFTLRLLVQEDMMDAAMGIFFLVMISLFAVATFLVIIRESESVYFQKKNTASEYYLEAQKTHYENLAKANREIRKIRHDMKNHIYCLQELNRSQKYEELSEYLDGISGSLQNAVSTVQIGNEIADAIISEKMSRAEEKNITFHVDGSMYDMDIKAIDICTIFANMLDNAIEAVEQLPEECRSVELSVRRNRNYHLISQSNRTPHRAEVVDNEIPSTKKDRKNHGFGIANIKDAVAKYDGECSVAVSEERDEQGYYTFQMDIMLPIRDNMTQSV